MNDGVAGECFLICANSMCYGDKLLTTIKPPTRRARALFEQLGLGAR